MECRLRRIRSPSFGSNSPINRKQKDLAISTFDFFWCSQNWKGASLAPFSFLDSLDLGCVKLPRGKGGIENGCARIRGLGRMSAFGTKRTSQHAQPMSALPPKADIVHGGGNVRFVPEADSCDAEDVCSRKAWERDTMSVRNTTQHDVWASGDAYEPFVGRWSRRVAREFIKWLGLAANSRWLRQRCAHANDPHNGRTTRSAWRRSLGGLRRLCAPPHSRFSREVPRRRRAGSTGRQQRV